MTKKKVIAALIAAVVIMPVLGMYIMFKTDMIAISFAIGIVETIIGGAICALLYDCGSALDDVTQENGF